MELVGFKPEVKDVVFKLASINLCSVVSGQALMELMINPPQEGDPSYPCTKAKPNQSITIWNQEQNHSIKLFTNGRYQM